MISVLDRPVASDGLDGFFGADGSGADIKCGFLPAVPQAVLGASDESRPGDADDVRDEPVPQGVFEQRTGIEDLDDTGLGAHALVPVEGFMAFQRRLRFCGPFDFPQQAGLIFLNLNKQMAVCLAGRAESFFDSAWRRA